MATPKGEQTRNHIIKETRKILVTRGFHNTKVSEIIAATGVKKGNLYYHFASKEDLGLAVLEDAKEEFFAFLDQAFQGKDPIDKIINSCEAIFREQRKNNFVGGCLFGNTALEMSDSNPRFAAVIEEVFGVWTERICRYLEKGRTERAATGEVPPKLLAKTVVATIEGGIMMSRVSKHRDELADCLAALKIILGRST